MPRRAIRRCSYYHASLFSPRYGDSVRSRSVFILVLAFAFGTLCAQEDAPAPTDDREPARESSGGFLQAPTVEPSPVAGESVEPEIAIIESGSDVVYEYRVRGVLYMVRVQPQFGPPYYFHDLDGDGVIDAQERSAKNTAIPQWVLFRWN